VTTPDRVEFELLGRTFTIRSEAPPEYVRSLVAYIEGRLAAVGGEPGQDPLKRLALVTLYLTDELFRTRDDQARREGDVSRQVDTLLELLEQVAPGHSDSA
jgi:hypothetical protein